MTSLPSAESPRASAAPAGGGGGGGGGGPPRKLSMFQKLERRARSDPLVFGFLGLTVGALGGGLWSLLRDNKAQSQLMMRYRVGFQSSTILALTGGIYYRAYVHKDDVAPRAAAKMDAVAFEARAGSAIAEREEVL